MAHASLKCDACLLCVREGEEKRRLGSVQITVWTLAGPYTLFLCGRCAERVRKVCNITDEILTERP